MFFSKLIRQNVIGYTTANKDYLSKLHGKTFVTKTKYQLAVQIDCRTLDGERNIGGIAQVKIF